MLPPQTGQLCGYPSTHPPEVRLAATPDMGNHSAKEMPTTQWNLMPTVSFKSTPKIGKRFEFYKPKPIRKPGCSITSKSSCLKFSTPKSTLVHRSLK
jgi:hypothetical protein